VLARVDRVVADTRGHAEYFHHTLGVERGRLFVVPVGADESLFRCAPMPSRDEGVDVLFYGSFLALQGPEFIVEAARMLAEPGVRVTLLGSGPLHERCVSLARDDARIRFEPWLDYSLLPDRIHRAHLCLGVFGVTPKAGRVIANKVYQCLASGRPVITRASDAYPPELLAQTQSAGLRFVAAGDPAALAAEIDAFVTRDHASAHRQAREVYDRFFSQASVTNSLAVLLGSMGLPAA
jgi:glycosyltransferase involved in cell wall biosynthesis